MITTQLIALDIIRGAGGTPIPPVPPSQQPFQGAGQGLGGDWEYHQKVEKYWAEIDATRDRQRKASVERDRAEEQAEADRAAIHARMAELRQIKATKKLQRERVAAELEALTQQQDELELALSAAIDEHQRFGLLIERLIAEVEDYQRRYKAALIVLLLCVN